MSYLLSYIGGDPNFLPATALTIGGHNFSVGGESKYHFRNKVIKLYYGRNESDIPIKTSKNNEIENSNEIKLTEENSNEIKLIEENSIEENNQFHEKNSNEIQSPVRIFDWKIVSKSFRADFKSVIIYTNIINLLKQNDFEFFWNF